VKRKLFYLILPVLFLAITLPLMAAETGKIAGVIRDEATGEPLPGVNVLIVGTNQGASTNIDGEYFILNVRPGSYDLRATAIGYKTLTMTGVMIVQDLTSEQNFTMEEAVLMGEEVTVTAERDVVRRDVTSSTHIVSREEIEALPVTTYQQALAATAGAVGTGTNIHIRGGRRDEILYLVDGLQIKDPQFQQRSLDVGSGSIAEMIVLTAGFNAEYGEAQSAVVNLVVREGEPEYHGHVSHRMDFDVNDFDTGDSYYQDYDYSEASVSGPEPITSELLPRLGTRIPGKMSLFAAGDIWSRNTNSHGVPINTSTWYRHQVTDIFGADVRKNQTFMATSTKLTYVPAQKYKVALAWNQSQQFTNPYWYRLSRVFPYDYTPEEQIIGIHALSQIRGYTSNATDFDNVFNVDDDGDGRVDEEALNWADDDLDGLIDEDLQFYEYNANDHTRTEYVRDQQVALSWNHTINQKTFYTVKLSAFGARRGLAASNKPANNYGEASESFTDLPNAEGKYNGRYDTGEPFVDLDGDNMYDTGNPGNATSSIYGFHIAGDGLAENNQQLVPYWADFESKTWTAKFDLASQMTSRHLVKTGLELNYYDVRTQDHPYPSYDNEGEGIYTDIYHWYPSQGAIYVQDKMEYKDIIVNAGIRMDYWNAGDGKIQEPVYRNIEEGERENYVDYQPPDKKFYFSPRLGISYSVTEKDVFHFNYGYFYQRSRLDYYYTAVNQLQTGGTPIVGNPDLDPMKTIAYELGVRHQFAQDFLLDVSTYYKDIKNWIQTASQNQLFFDLYNRVLVGSNAAIYYNADYASIRGFEFNISKQYGANLAGRLTYTLAWASGKNSYNIGSDVTRANYVDPKRETPLGWDRRHSIVANIGFNFPLKGEPFSPAWLQSGWSVNILSQALSGTPYTPTNANGTDIEGREFSERSPWTYATDLDASREFKFGKLACHLLLEVRNLFNAHNILGWDLNRYTIDTYVEHGGRAGYINDNISPNYGLNPKAGPNPDAWDERRLVRLGLSFDF
jgi:outer membrane receptor for ferrienterochelin and colicin